MPRLHYVVKARKDNPAVKAGESYYWWKFPYRGKQYSATKPARSRLTQSDFLATIYDLEDTLLDAYDEVDLEDLVGQLEELRDQCQESLANMPDELQDTSDSGMMLQERIAGLEEWIGELIWVDWETLTPEDVAAHAADSNPGTW